MFFSIAPNKTLIFEQVLTEIVVCNNIFNKKRNKSKNTFFFLS